MRQTKEDGYFDFVLERTNPDGSYTVIGRYEDFDEAVSALKAIDSSLRHEISSPAWVNTDFGYAPMAWKN